MDSKDIKDKKFSKAINGYKTDEVDDFLEKIATELVYLKKLCSAQEKKIIQLTEKLEERKNSEYMLGGSFAGSQKQENTVLTASDEEVLKRILRRLLLS